MNDEQRETQLQEKGLSAPRITPSHIESKIVSEHYFTAAEGARIVPEDSPLHLLTFCVLVLENGFTVTGKSACASPENFNTEIGQEIARAAAVEKIWLLEGYLLKQDLYESAPAT